MKSDIQIQKDVMEQLKCEPFLDAAEIGVAVKNGIVTLSGQVDSYSKKLVAEKTTKKVAGVKAIAEDIHIGVSPGYNKTDAEIAADVLFSLKSHTMIPEDKMKVKVENTVVYLEGEVEWEYQRTQAEIVIENLTGIHSVTNMITVKPRVTPVQIQQKINEAFHRSATIDAKKITVEVVGSWVKLRGKVRSFSEKEDAEKAAWKAPGVTGIESILEIEEAEYSSEES